MIYMIYITTGLKIFFKLFASWVYDHDDDCDEPINDDDDDDDEPIYGDDGDEPVNGDDVDEGQ